MAKVFFQVQTGPEFVLEVVKTAKANIVRNRTTPVGVIEGLDQEDPSKVTVTFADKAEHETWLGYIAELKKGGKEGALSEVEVAINLSKQLLADGREKPYLKQEGFYGEYTPKKHVTSTPKGEKVTGEKTHTRTAKANEFLGSMESALNASKKFGEVMITVDESMEIVFGGLIYYIKPKVRGKIKSTKNGKVTDAEEVEISEED